MLKRNFYPNTNDFENLSFNPFNVSGRNFIDTNDPDEISFEELSSDKYKTPYIFEEEIKPFLSDIRKHKHLSLLHLNIRSMNANFEEFKRFLDESDFSFKNLICLSETWLSDKTFRDNSQYHLPNYEAIHFELKVRKRGGGLLIYIRDDLIYKIRKELCISDGDREILSDHVPYSWYKFKF